MKLAHRNPTSYRSMAALDLARAFIGDVHRDADEEARDRMESTILCAAQHVYERSGPRRWAAFDAAHFDRQMRCANPAERCRMLLDIAGFFGWLGANHVISAARAVAILRGLERLGPADSPHTELAATQARLLSQLAP